MARLSDFQPGKPIYPKDETDRTSAFGKYRKLYDGTWAIPEGGPEQAYEYRVNWYKRIAHAYAEFLCSDRATFEIENFSGDESEIRNFSQMFFSALYPAVVNMVRFGTGVLALPFITPGIIASYSPEQWYPLYDEYYDSQIGDVVARVLKKFIVVDLYVYGEVPVRRVFQRKTATARKGIFEGRDQQGTIGNRVSSDSGTYLSDDHIAPMPIGYVEGGYGESFYDDLERSVNEMGRLLGLLSQNVARNSDPALYGPEGAVTINEDGEYEIEDGGQYIPVEPGGIPPGYLQWDSETNAVKEGFGLSEELVYVFSGLPRGLFDPSVVSGNSTGSALRRALIPLIVRLSSISGVVKRGAVPLFRKWAGFNLNASYDDSDVQITFGYESLLGDLTEGETDVAPTQPTQPTAE